MNIMMNLDKYLRSKGHSKFEGYSKEVPDQLKILKQIICKKDVKNILEIGFNAGHSSCFFLENNPQCKVLSFDIGIHKYVAPAKEFINSKYPKRHSLFIGDSTKTIPNFNNNKLYDIIFIDGGHDYEIAIQDLMNCKKFAHKDTIVIMDDTIYNKEWEKDYTIGPTKSWNEGIQNNIITNIENIDFSNGRGMSWGKYIL